MSRIRITHLTFTGRSVPKATLEFGPNLTVVHGPSDTGKSFIVSAIDFMFGAQTLKEIPELEGYSNVMLGLEFSVDERVTLVRSVEGGKFSLYRNDVRDEPLEMPDCTLSPKHDADNENNLSRFLLQMIDLDGKRVRKNQNNETNSLSYRDLAHLCIVDETSMQSEEPPALSGQYTSKTKESSVLKLLLQNEDDSGLKPSDSKDEKTKLQAAKIEIIERLIDDLELKVANEQDASELRDQLSRISESVARVSQAVGTVLSTRESRVSELSKLQDRRIKYETDTGELKALHNRFELLMNLYNSELSRLASVREFGTLLNYFERGTCVFCGAEPKDQHVDIPCIGQSNGLGVSIDSEIRKVDLLKADLKATIDELANQIQRLSGKRQKNIDSTTKAQAELDAIDLEIQPKNIELKELLAKRSEIERLLGIFDQLGHLERLKNQIADDKPAGKESKPVAMRRSVVNEFSQEISNRLAAWGYPEASDVRYSASAQDIQDGEQFRSGHGKGVRAILHAAFTIALAQYCLSRDTPHPGVVVLDSPLVTYRAPAGESELDSGPSLPPEFPEAFYRDIEKSFLGQVIVFENTEPPSSLNTDSVDVVFTKSGEHGRSGFFPK